ncbi:MAG: hypothetical protein JNM56_02690 [Planctomycetia bacterium]|nr:hypothetical protein [Planctomycetia bacterium]
MRDSRPEFPAMTPQAASDPLHGTFLTMLPRIERHARVYFRNVKDSNRKADYIQETIALSWKWLRRLHARGKDATQFVSTLATFAARAVRSGRRLCGQEKAKDVLSPRAQQRHGFAVGKLPDFATLNGNPLEEALQDNTRTPPPEAAAFRIDFPAWRRTHTRRNRRIIDRMAQGERTQVLARQFDLSPARVSQLRRHFHDDWNIFCADCAELPTAVATA